MLKVNVGLSKKLSKDFNSSGYSINVEGEVTAPTSDPEGVTAEVKQLYDLAAEALAVQIERSQGTATLASRAEPSTSSPPSHGNGHQLNGGYRHTNGNGQAQIATNKQIQYLLSIGKRQRLSTIELEQRVAEILGQKIDIYDLTKRQAVQVSDMLTGNGDAQQSFQR